MHTHALPHKERWCKYQLQSEWKCILPTQPPSINIHIDWAAFFRCKLVTGAGAADFTGGCENQSVGFRLAGIALKGGQEMHQSREPREQTQTAQSELPALNFQTARPAGESHSGAEASRIVSSAGPSPPLAWTSTHLKPQYVFLINFQPSVCSCLQLKPMLW